MDMVKQNFKDTNQVVLPACLTQSDAPLEQYRNAHHTPLYYRIMTANDTPTKSKTSTFSSEKIIGNSLFCENAKLPLGSLLSFKGMNTTELFYQIIKSKTSEDIAVTLGLHSNTINRWMDTNNIPWQYHGDFLRMLGQDGDINLWGDGVKDKDQFYTKPAIALECYNKFLTVAEEMGINLSNYKFIEPSAGCGWFYQHLPSHRKIGIDIDPNGKYIDELTKADYLRWEPNKIGSYVVIGNPPFGLRGHLALQFINHSAKFADMVAFILPQLFESDGKGVPGKRVDKKFALAYSERLPEDSFEKPDGTPIPISTVFQIWTAINKNKIKIPSKKTCSSYIRIYSLSDGGTPSSTRNKKMIGSCHIYLPSTCFSGMKAYESFDELPNKRGYGVLIHKNIRQIKSILLNNDWGKTAFRSTNGALNLRTGLIQNVITEKGIYDD